MSKTKRKLSPFNAISPMAVPVDYRHVAEGIPNDCNECMFSLAECDLPGIQSAKTFSTVTMQAFSDMKLALRYLDPSDHLAAKEQWREAGVIIIRYSNSPEIRNAVNGYGHQGYGFDGGKTRGRKGSYNLLPYIARERRPGSDKRVDGTPVARGTGKQRNSPRGNCPARGIVEWTL